MKVKRELSHSIAFKAMAITMTSIHWLKSQIQSCFLALGLPVHQILAKSFTVEILAHAEAHVLNVLPRDGTNYIASERLLSLGLGLAALMSQQDKYGKVFILLLLQPRPF